MDVYRVFRLDSDLCFCLLLQPQDASQTKMQNPEGDRGSEVHHYHGGWSGIRSSLFVVLGLRSVGDSHCFRINCKPCVQDLQELFCKHPWSGTGAAGGNSSQLWAGTNWEWETALGQICMLLQRVVYLWAWMEWTLRRSCVRGSEPWTPTPPHTPWEALRVWTMSPSNVCRNN